MKHKQTKQKKEKKKDDERCRDFRILVFIFPNLIHDCENVFGFSHFSKLLIVFIFYII